MEAWTGCFRARGVGAGGGRGGGGGASFEGGNAIFDGATDLLGDVEGVEGLRDAVGDERVEET